MTNPFRGLAMRQATPLSYSAVVLADSPLAYWRCEDAFGAGTLTDSSGNARTMTLNSATHRGAYSKNARLGKCVSFTDGVGYGSIASAAWHQLTGDMTMEAWFKLETTPGNGSGYTFLSCSSAGGAAANNRLYQFQLQQVGGVVGFGNFHESGTNVGITNTQTNYTPVEGQWYHYACVRDTTALTYARYVNGALIGSVSYSANPTSGTSGALNLNRNADGTNQIGKWSLDEVAIYNTKLSATRIFEHYRAGRRSTPSAWDRTALLCRFDGTDTATTCPDDSSFGRVLTFNGNAQIDTAQSKFGGASLLLDGTGDFVSLSDSPFFEIVGQEFTIEAWVRISTGSKIQTICGKRDAAGAEEHTFYVDATNHLTFQPNASGSAILTLADPNAMSTATWYHVVAQRKAANLWTLHRDGVLVASSTTAGTATTNAQGFTIGRNPFNTVQDWDGWIDGFRVTMGESRYAAANFTPPAAAYEPYK